MLRDDAASPRPNAEVTRVIVPAELAPDTAGDLFAEQGARDNGLASQALSLRGIARYKGSIICTLLAVAVPAITAIWWLVTPQYRARATVEISPTNPRVLYKTEDNGLIPMYQQYLNSQVGIIGGNRVLQRVVERKDVQETAWYQSCPWYLFGRAESPLHRLRSSLEVRPRSRTFLIDIDFVATAPSDARVIVGAVLGEYQREARDRVKDTDVVVLGALEQTLSELQMSIAGRQKLAEELRRDLGTSTPEQLIAQKRLRLDELEARIREVGRELELAQWQRERLESALGRQADEPGEVTDAGDEAARAELLARRQFENDTEWWRLHMALQDAQLRVELEGKRLGQEHPTMVRLDNETQRLAQQLQDRESRVREIAEHEPDSALEHGLDGVPLKAKLASKVASLEKEKGLLAAAFREQRGLFTVEFEKAGQLVSESEELDRHKNKADLVRARLDEKETERGPVALIRVISKPLTPSKPYRDRRPVWTGVAALLGLAGALALAFIRGAMSQTIHEVDQLAASVRAPFLGSLPLLKPKALPAPEEDALEQEHYRMLRTALLSRLAGSRGNVTLVTSGSPGVGKTTVSVRLARSLARCGKRVLLVDSDIRACGVADLLGISRNPGLVEVLRGQEDDADAIVPTEIPGLDILPAGRSNGPEDTELLANGVFAASLKRWRERYDLILLDSPPVLPVADARILSRHADGTILVVREGHCRRSELVDTLAFLGVAGGRLLGTVYIGARSGSSRYYGYAYGGYGSATDGAVAKLDVRQS